MTVMSVNQLSVNLTLGIGQCFAIHVTICLDLKVDMFHLSSLTLHFDALLQFNFVGRLLGPRGNSLKRLQEETRTRMAIFGRGSVRNKEQVGIEK